MGLLDLPAPIFGALDSALGAFLPGFLRLLLWGVLAGWLTMITYRRLSNQEKIGRLKAEQKVQQKLIADFDGEFNELLPLIRKTLGTGFRQLGLALGPALLATVPVLFLVVWVAGRFAYDQPEIGEIVSFTPEPARAELHWQPPEVAAEGEDGWSAEWPAPGQNVRLSDGRNNALLELPLERMVPVIHKKRWWNLLMANPIGYLPDESPVEIVHIGLPENTVIGTGPDWIRGWMFTFFLSFLLASVGFKFVLKID